MIEVSSLISSGYQYVDGLVGGNQFASGLILGSITATITYLVRNIPLAVFNYLKRQLTTTLTVHSSHESFHHLMRYFAEEGLSGKSRTVKLSNGRWGSDSTVKSIGYGTHLYFFKYTPVLIEISVDTSGNNDYVKENASLTVFGRSHRMFDKLLSNITSLDHTDNTKYYDWDHGKVFVSEQPKINLDNVVLHKEDVLTLKNTLDNFINNEQWYLDNNVPYQLGIILHGPPGTGKTSLIRAIAAYVNKGIVSVNDVNGLIQVSKSVSSEIICVEEIDTLGMEKRGEPKNEMEEMMSSFSSFSLGRLLTSLDGLIPNHGRILVMTTNHIEKLDEALIRPGRVDLSLYMGYLSIETFSLLLKKFFKEEYDLSKYKMNGSHSPAKVQGDIISGKSVEELIDMYAEIIIDEN